MQNGSIYRHGCGWMLTYREPVVEDGVQKLKRRYKKLHPVDHAHRVIGKELRDLAAVLAPSKKRLT